MRQQLKRELRVHLLLPRKGLAMWQNSGINEENSAHYEIKITLNSENDFLIQFKIFIYPLLKTKKTKLRGL
jgi:hypothetical protein